MSEEKWKSPSGQTISSRDTDKTKELKPCPFCGCTFIECDIYEIGGKKPKRTVIAGCPDCGVKFTGKWPRAAAIKAWNTRTNEPQTVSGEDLSAETFENLCHAACLNGIDDFVSFIKENFKNGVKVV